MNNQRYFIIWFSGLTEDGMLQNGKIEHRTDNGMFFNERWTIEFVSKAFNLSMVFIKDFRELSKQDFYDYIAGRPEPSNPDRPQNGETDSPEMDDDFL